MIEREREKRIDKRGWREIKSDGNRDRQTDKKE